MPDNNTVYNIIAAPFNAPTLKSIGELQFLEDTIAYPIDTWSRKPSDFFHGWLIPNQAINNTLLNPLYLRTLDNSFRLDHSAPPSNSTLVVTKDITRSVYLTLDSDLLVNEIFSHANCTFQILSIAACRGCILPTQLLLSAHSIHTPGLLTFKSNCAFDRNTLSCSSDPTTLTCIGRCSPPCLITLAGHKDPILDIAFEEQDLGVLSQYTDIDNVSPSSFYDNFFNDNNSSYLFGGLLGGVGLFVLLKVFLACWALRQAHDLLK